MNGAGKSEITVPSLCDGAQGHVAWAGVVQGAAVDGESAGAERGVVVEVQLAGIEGGATGVGVGAGKRPSAAVLFGDGNCGGSVRDNTGDGIIYGRAIKLQGLRDIVVELGDRADDHRRGRRSQDRGLNA